jgi:hypothetical protein
MLYLPFVGIAGVIGELYGVDKVDVETQQLQREYCSFVADITTDDMALDAEHPTATFDASHDQQCLVLSVTSSALSEADFDDVALISAMVF